MWENCSDFDPEVEAELKAIRPLPLFRPCTECAEKDRQIARLTEQLASLGGICPHCGARADLPPGHVGSSRSDPARGGCMKISGVGNLDENYIQALRVEIATLRQELSGAAACNEVANREIATLRERAEAAERKAEEMAAALNEHLSRCKTCGGIGHITQCGPDGEPAAEPCPECGMCDPTAILARFEANAKADALEEYHQNVGLTEIAENALVDRIEKYRAGGAA